MTFALRIRCDYPDCDAEAFVTAGRGSWDGMPCLADNNEPDGRPNFVLDTGWLDMPEGWSFVEDGDRCPAHRDPDLAPERTT